MKGLENDALLFRRNANSRVRDLGGERDLIISEIRPGSVMGADRYPPAAWRELDGILNEVPEDLLEPSRVGIDVVVNGP